MITSNIYNRAFWNAVRGKQESSEMREGLFEDGAYVLPMEFRENFAAALEKDNLFRKHASIVSINKPDFSLEAVASTGTADWTAPGFAYPESSDRFTSMKLNPCKLAALARIKNSFIRDARFNLEKYMAGEFARRFGRIEESGFLNGNGETQPCGILHEEKGAQLGVTSASETMLTFDEVKALYFALKPEFRRNAVWVMNDNTAFHLRTLKDGSGASLWNHNADTIFGKPVEISPYMPDMESGAKPVLLADLRYYWVVERQPLSVRILTEIYAIQGQTGLAAYEMLDGRLVMPEAAVVVRMR